MDNIHEDEASTGQILGVCVHKDAFPGNKYEVLGYLVVFGLVYMLFYTNFVNEGYVVMILFLFFQFTAVESVGYINVINI